jgi:chondroitin AC lyase
MANSILISLKRYASRFLGRWICAPFLISAGAAQSTEQEIQTIKKRVIENFISGGSVDIEEVNSLLARLQADGLWEGVDYTSTQRSNWPIFYHHYQRTTVLTRALVSPDSPFYNDPELKTAVLVAVNAWLIRDWTNPNWWYNEIGGPLSLGPVLLALEDELTPEQVQKGMAILERGRIGMTGANRTWLATVTLYRGLLEDSPAVISNAVAAIESTLGIGETEGLQSDWSFRQHGEVLYNHGYGAALLSCNTQTALLTTGTSLAMKPEFVDKLLSMVLDGNQWMLHGLGQDYGASGRNITRPGLNSNYLFPIIDRLQKLTSNRKKELDALRAHLENPTENPPVTGNRDFRASDYMAHKREGYFASARTHSTRIFNTDTPSNQEGLRSHFLADGANFLFLEGDEYHDIFGAWDWRRIPGTTVNLEQGFSDSPRWKGQTDFVGGASDGTYGVTAFDFNRGSTLQARKSWFFFDDEYVCLGAGITSTANGVIFTTLNQCHLRGRVVVADAEGQNTVSPGTYDISGPVAVHHAGVGYILLDEKTILLRTLPQTGKWSDSNVNTYAEVDESTLDLFLLGIQHGTTPENDKYAYVVAPGMDVQSMSDYTANPAVEVLSNTTEIQAVRHDALGITQAVFYRPGELSRAGITVNHPCLFMVRDSGDTLEVTVSDPSQLMTGDLQIQLARPVAGVFEADGEVTVDQIGPTLDLRVMMTDSNGRSLKVKFNVPPEHLRRHLNYFQPSQLRNSSDL